MTKTLIPTPWATIIVDYGEAMKHLYRIADTPIGFHKTEEDAQKHAEQIVLSNPKAMVSVLQVDHLVMAKPVQFEIITTKDSKDD